MLHSLIRWSLYNPFLIVALTLLTLAGGVYALWRTPLDAIDPLMQVNAETHFRARRQRMLTCESYVGEHGAQHITVLSRFAHLFVRHRHKAHEQRHDGKHHQQFDQRKAALTPHAALAAGCGAQGVLRTSAFSPSPPGALSAPSERISMPPFGPGLA